MYCLAPVLHVVLRPEWYGMLYSQADSKKKSNLMMSLFEPGPEPLPWLGKVSQLGPISGNLPNDSVNHINVNVFALTKQCRPMHFYNYSLIGGSLLPFLFQRLQKTPMGRTTVRVHSQSNPRSNAAMPRMLPCGSRLVDYR